MDRVPLSNKEYFALLTVVGSYNCLKQMSDSLNTRCGWIENGREDMETAITTLERLFSNLLPTVPVKKLKALSEELKNAKYELKVAPDFTGGAKDKGLTYVSVEAMEKLVMQVINDNCTFCDKSTAKSKQCRLLPIIEDCFPWDMSPRTDGCPLRGSMFTED